MRDKIRFRTEVIAARFDETRAMWDVRVRTPEGVEETVSAQALISAVGQLNRPKLPDIPGLDTFAGPAFHSATWRHDVDLDGKRVAVIGTGASAFQLVPEVAKQAARLYVFQRQPPWMTPNPRLPLPSARREEVAAAARPVLRAVAPLRDLLAGVGRHPEGGGDRSGVAESRAFRERPERDDAVLLHRLDHPAGG